MAEVIEDTSDGIDAFLAMISGNDTSKRERSPVLEETTGGKRRKQSSQIQPLEDAVAAAKMGNKRTSLYSRDASPHQSELKGVPQVQHALDDGLMRGTGTDTHGAAEKHAGVCGHRAQQAGRDPILPKEGGSKGIPVAPPLASSAAYAESVEQPGSIIMETTDGRDWEIAKLKVALREAEDSLERSIEHADIRVAEVEAREQEAVRRRDLAVHELAVEKDTMKEKYVKEVEYFNGVWDETEEAGRALKEQLTAKDEELAKKDEQIRRLTARLAAVHESHQEIVQHILNSHQEQRQAYRKSKALVEKPDHAGLTG